MGVLITTADFKGKYVIPQNSFTNLDAFINDTEESYLYDLMGALLYAAFKATLTPAPPATPTTRPLPVGVGYLAIYNPFNLDYGSKIFKSKGIVTMLLGFIYFDFMRQIKYKATLSGIVVTATDAGAEVQPANLYSYLNDATTTFNSIQEYIQNIHPEQFNLANTTPFNGQKKSFGISIFE